MIMASRIRNLIKKDIARSEATYRKFLLDQKRTKAAPGQLKTALRAPDTLIRESAKEAVGMVKAGAGAVKKAGQAVGKTAGGIRKKITDARTRLRSNVRNFDPEEGRLPGLPATPKKSVPKPAEGVRAKKAPAAKPTIASTKKKRSPKTARPGS